MTISTDYLNRIAYRATHSSPVHDEYGDVSSELNVVGDNVGIPIRITRNKEYWPGATMKQGYAMAAASKGFIEDTEIVEIGDFIFDSETYRAYEVLHVDIMPGGISDHHKELYLKSTDAKELAGGLLRSISSIAAGKTGFDLYTVTFIPTLIKLHYGTDPDNENFWSYTSPESSANRGTAVRIELRDLPEVTQFYGRMVIFWPNRVAMEQSYKFMFKTGDDETGVEEVGKYPG